MGLAETAKLIASLELEDHLSKGIKSATSSLNGFDKGLGRVSKGAGQLSAGFTRAGTIVAGAAVTGLGAAAKAAIDWEDAFAGVVKTVDEADLSKAGLTFRDLELSLRKMSTTMPVAASDLAAIAEAGGALGIAGKDIVEFTRVVALIGSTTDVSTEQAATSLGQLSNVIGLTAADYDNFAATLVDLGNKGASTESQILEIASRAGAGAKLIGVAADATLGWASATANLGIEVEAGGSALQKFFLKSLDTINEGGQGLAKYGKVAGLTAKQFKKAFDKDASGALQKFLAGLGKLDKASQLNILQDLGFKDIRITRLLLGLANDSDNLSDSLTTGAAAWEANTAAQEEFEKRNKTVRSAFTRLKNTAIDAAITLGEGFAPALGRSADQLAKFLAVDSNRNELKSIGEDIGKAIDGIDWKEVISGAKTFVSVLKVSLDYAKRIFDILNALPTEVKAAGLGLIGLNKLSGGLVGAGLGNIIGGLGGAIAKTLAASLPGVGKAFVQPVFVTNMPLGGLGGGAAGAAATGLSGLAKVFLVGEAIGLALAVNEVRTAVNNESTAHATAIQNQTSTWLAQQPSRTDLVNGLAAVDTGIRDLKSNPLNVLVQGEALSKLEQMRSQIAAALKDLGPNGRDSTTQAETTKGNVFGPGGLGQSITDAQEAAANRVTTSVETMKGSLQTAIDTTKVSIASAVSEGATLSQQAAFAVRDRVSTAASQTTAATYSGTSQIVGAIRAIPAPIVNVNVSATTVEKTTTVTNRYGRTLGDRDGVPDSGFGGR